MLYIYAQLEYSFQKINYLWILLSYSNLKYIEKLQTILVQNYRPYKLGHDLLKFNHLINLTLSPSPQPSHIAPTYFTDIQKTQIYSNIILS